MSAMIGKIVQINCAGSSANNFLVIGDRWLKIKPDIEDKTIDDKKPI